MNPLSDQGALCIITYTEMRRRDALPLVCKTWAAICNDTPALWEDVIIDADDVHGRHDRQLSLAAALAWLQRRPRVKDLTVRRAMERDVALVMLQSLGVTVPGLCSFVGHLTV